MRSALAVHDEIVRGALESAGGLVFSTGGDGFGAAFSRAGEAVAAALAAQRRLAAQDWPDGISLKVRMGLHTGEADERDGDYFGPDVSRTARLMAIAHGGQIVWWPAIRCRGLRWWMWACIGCGICRSRCGSSRCWGTGCRPDFRPCCRWMPS